MKILHIGFHNGLANDLYYIAEQLHLDLTFIKFTDGISKNSELYNITEKKANIAWNYKKDYYNLFDIIIVSDTTPISRVFLQNKYEGKLIIWVCNRFDYSIKRHDRKYYDLIKSADCDIYPYTQYEYIHMLNKNIQISTNVIKPVGIISEYFKKNIKLHKNNVRNVPDNINKKGTFFIPPYHNDTHFLNLYDKVTSINIRAYRGKYNGPNDIQDFKGIIHIPYAWANVAFFENLQLGLIYFIPSLKFLLFLKSKHRSFFWSPPFISNYLTISEWYCDGHKDLIVYFDSWDDLKMKTENIDYVNKKQIIKQFCENHTNIMLNKWRNILTD